MVPGSVIFQMVLTIECNIEATRAYARHAKNKELEIDASEIRIRAERRSGETVGLANGTAGTGGNQHMRRVPNGPAAPTLAEAGIDKHLADRAPCMPQLRRPSLRAFLPSNPADRHTAAERHQSGL